MTIAEALEALAAHDPFLALQVAHASDSKRIISMSCSFTEAPLLIITELDYVEEALRWVKSAPKRHLVIAESDQGKWRDWLSCEGILQILNDPQIHCALSPSKLASIAWKYLFELYQIVPYKTSVAAVIDGVHLAASEASDYRVGSITNLLTLLEQNGVWIDGRHLENSHAGCPALICGAGPSLEKEIPYIREFSQRGIIIACGAAIGLLAQQGIKVDFAAAVDPQSPKERLLDEIEAPLFFQTRLAPHVAERVRGEKIFMGSNTLFPLEERTLSLGGAPSFFFDAGWNAATFGVATALFLGCDRLFLVGVDHGYTANPYAFDLSPAVEQKAYIACREGRYTKKDFELAEIWLEEVRSIYPDRLIAKELDHHLPVLNKKPVWRASSFNVQGIDIRKKILNELKEALKPFEEKESLLISLLLRTTPLYSDLLQPIWEVWRYLFERQEGDLLWHELLFYHRVIVTYVDKLST